MNRFSFLKLAVIGALCGVGAEAAADSVVLNRAVLSTGQTLTVSVVVDQARNDDVYVAVRTDSGQYYFVTNGGGFVPYVAGQPSPSVLSAPPPGVYDVLNMLIPPNLSGQFDGWLVRGAPNVDIIASVQAAKGATMFRGSSIRLSNNVADVVDLDSIDPVLVQINLNNDVTGDLDDDGFPDDDLDLDGIPDDDLADDPGDDLVDDDVDDDVGDDVDDDVGDDVDDDVGDDVDDDVGDDDPTALTIKRIKF